jgi:hypothetical protein
MPATTLREFLAELRNAEVIVRPENEEWRTTIERMSVPGRIAEVDETTFDWFLDCLPPKWMGDGFAFAEGAEPLRYFWKRNGRYFVRQLTWDETESFCRFAGISLPC